MFAFLVNFLFKFLMDASNTAIASSVNLRTFYVVDVTIYVGMRSQAVTNTHHSNLLL